MPVVCCHVQRVVTICLAIYVGISVLFTTNALLSFSFKKSTPDLPWFDSTHGKQITLESKILGSHSIEESIILSKAFPHLMKPSQIIPYYYRASGAFHKEDVTITSLITSNRFHTLARLVEQYQGMLAFFSKSEFDFFLVAYTRSYIRDVPHKQRYGKCTTTPRIPTPPIYDNSEHGDIR